ncbi:MAG: molybdate transport system ATP-binding protein [Actinomycetota bacterium]|nr:molybdate transport system ATP-binding protein [Actinomycetota bacterium]
MSLDASVRVSLDDFSLEVELQVDDGEMLAVLGPNGSGKTTLLRTLSGLLPIDDGRISIDGRVVDDPAADTFIPAEERPVGFVFQDYLLFGHLGALDNVAFGLRERGSRRSAARARARTLLREVGVDVNPAARPGELSGGQAQRVALARALATEPTLLLLDEPLAALDVQTRVETRQLLRDVLARFAGARVLVTHDPIDAFTLADRLLIVENGRPVQQGRPDEVLNNPRSAYVAELAGVNLYRGRAAGDQIRVGGEVVVAADAHDGDVLAIIPPHAVVLHRARPEGSARNVWPGTIIGIERTGGRVRVRVAGPMPIIAEVTAAAIGALGLTEGSEVWAAVKATEVDVHPA